MPTLIYDSGHYDADSYDVDPNVPVPAHLVELYLNSTWTAVSVYNSAPIKITTGRSPESRQATTSSLSFSLPNADGRYTSKNPLGIYYGQFKQGVPVRVRVSSGVTRLASPVSAGSFDTTHRVTCPDAAQLDIAGDLDLRIDRSGRFDGGILIAKTNAYYLTATSQGIPFLQWYDSGANLLSALATDVVPTQGRVSIRCTLDVDNGASGRTITFYTSDSVNGTWTQLGAAIVQSGTTSIRNSLEGGVIGGGTDSYVYAGQIRNGLAGTIVAAPDFTVQSEGTTSFTDSTGLLWTVNGRSSVTHWSTRFAGFVTETEPSWDRSQNVVTQSVLASGVLRRIYQPGSPDQSSYYKAMFARSPIAYWPMEDAQGSTTFGAVSPNTQPATLSGGPITLANDSTFVGSQPLPTFGGPEGMTGLVPAYTITAAGCQVRWLMKSTGPSGAFTMRLLTSGAHYFDLSYTPSSTVVRLDMFNRSTGALEATNGPFVLGYLATTGGRCSIELRQNGTGIDCNFVSLAPGATSGNSFGIVTIPSATLGLITAVQPFQTDPALSTVIGHVTVENTISSIFDTGVGTAGDSGALNGWAGEQAANRALRLAAAAAIDIDQIGIAASSSMGTEPINDLPTKLQQCVDAGEDLLLEARAFAGLYYRARQDMQSIPPSLRLAYSLLTEDTAPVEDDQLLVNDWTLTREGGSSARYTQDAGNLSTQPSPNGVGRYPDSQTLNLQFDSQLANHASWRVHQGTIDEPRFPVISLDLHSPRVAPFTLAVLDVQIGDWLALTGPPLWFPPVEVQQQVFQVVETITVETYNVTFSGRPARAQRVPVLTTPFARMDTSGSTLNVSVNSASTTLSVLSTGSLWVTTAVDATAFPFNITCDGEIMAVTAITGSSSPQTFTVTRGVNGVVRAHTLGAALSLAEPSYYGV